MNVFCSGINIVQYVQKCANVTIDDDGICTYSDSVRQKPGPGR